MLLEVCVDDIEGFEAAIFGGAGRIELCSALALGGLSPLPGLIAHAKTSGVPVMAMVRPRAGNFVWTAREVDQMLFEIEHFRAQGFAGVVLGANLADGRLDGEVLRRLVDAAEGLDTTLHRAFDVVTNLAEAIELAIELGFKRILTSGRAVGVMEGLSDIQAAVELAAGRIKILGGGSVNAQNIEAFLTHSGVDEVHASGSMRLPDTEGPLATLGFEYSGRKVTSAEHIQKLSAVAARF